MRVGIDGRNLLNKGTGVTTYAAMLAKTCRLAGFDPRLVTTSEPLSRMARLLSAINPSQRLHPSLGNLVARDLFRVAHLHFGLYRRSLALRIRDDLAPRIMHWTYPLPIHIPSIANLVTIHDLIPLRHPQLTGIAAPRMRRLLSTVIAHAEFVVTVSETVRREIIAEFGTSPDKVVNLYQAVDLPPAHPDNAEALTPLCPPGQFLIFGTVETRKNIGRIIQAHAESGIRTPLVIIGPDGQGAAAELAPAARHPLGPTAVCRIDWSPRPALIRAIREARAVLFPSLAEGFGLPILEGMTLGTPVMTSRGGATEEIAGGAALLVDPFDIRDMANGIAMLDRDAGLRYRLRTAGLRRAGAFSLEGYTARLKDFYLRVSHGRRQMLF